MSNILTCRQTGAKCYKIDHRVSGELTAELRSVWRKEGLEGVLYVISSPDSIVLIFEPPPILTVSHLSLRVIVSISTLRRRRHGPMVLSEASVDFPLHEDIDFRRRLEIY
jgi:hypothetical protein